MHKFTEAEIWRSFFVSTRITSKPLNWFWFRTQPSFYSGVLLVSSNSLFLVSLHLSWKICRVHDIELERLDVTVHRQDQDAILSNFFSLKDVIIDIIIKFTHTLSEGGHYTHIHMHTSMHTRTHIYIVCVCVHV